MSDTKEVFTNIKPVIEEVAKGEMEIPKKLAKVSDALDDIVPICVLAITVPESQHLSML